MHLLMLVRLRSAIAILAAVLIGFGFGGTTSSAAEPGRVVRTDDPAKIAELAAQARPGDTIVLADGTYRDVQIVFNAEGRPGSPVTLRAETAGEVILTGASSMIVRGSDVVVRGLWFKDGGFNDPDKKPRQVIYFNADHSRMTRCAVTHYSAEQKKTGYYWVKLLGRHNRIDHCYFKGMKNNGWVLLSITPGKKPNFHRIDHNYFADRPRDTNSVIRIGVTATQERTASVTVEYNYFENCDGDTEIITNKSPGNIYRYNTFVDCRGVLSIRQGRDCIVKGNLFIDCMGGVYMTGSHHRVVDNTIVRSREWGISLYYGVEDEDHVARYLPVHDCLIAGNTIITSETGAGLIIGQLRNKRWHAERWTKPPYNDSATMVQSVAPHDNMIRDNSIMGPSQRLLVVDHAPDNVLKSNLVWEREAEKAAASAAR